MIPLFDTTTDELIKACEALKKDLIERGDHSYGAEIVTVNASDSIWREFKRALAEAQK